MSAPPAPQRTPISLLQELCARHGVTPDYKLLSVEGAVHAPTFMYRVQVSEVFSTATGQSKKKAKHSAAKAILENLISENGLFSKNSITNDGIVVDIETLDSVVSEPAENAATAEDDIPGNPVGTLQELCMKRRCPPPYYETVMEDGLPHERMFGICCYMSSFNIIGIGKSKRLAKRQAAQKMLEKVEDLISKGVNLSENDTEETQANNNNEKAFVNGYEPNTDQKTAKSATSHGLLMAQFLENLNDAEDIGRVRAALEVDHQDNYVVVLQFITEQLNFEVIYTPIKELAQNGKHQCLVQLGTIPIAVCFGSGLLAIEAKQDAAHNTLHYLEIMSKKRQ